jgi:flavin-dependent dehydrogenase
VLVAGAGPGGCAAAIVLARGGCHVVLADPRVDDPPRRKIGETLPAAATTALLDLRIAPERLEACGATRSTGTSSAWGRPEPVTHDAIFDPLGPGWHLDRARFDALLLDEARTAGAQVRAQRVGVEQRVPPGGAAAWGLRLRLGNTPATAGCVIDATGRPAAVARRLGARRARADRLVAVHATIDTTPADVDARTRIEATPCGWWYSALVSRQRRVTAFLTDADLLHPALRSGAGFAAALAATTHVLAPVERFDLLAPPVATAAHGARLSPSHGATWIAVGDAAVAFDPLSSQGILNALLTGMSAATTVIRQAGRESGASLAYEQRLAGVWAAYERNRAGAYALESRWRSHPFWARRCGG